MVDTVWTKRPHSLCYPVMPIPHARRMNLIALALLITALISLIAFHVAPFGDSLTSDGRIVRGWVVWELVISVFTSGELLQSSIAVMLAWMSLPMSMALVASAPFLIHLLRGSRPIWWIVLIMTSVCLVAISWLIWELSRDPITTPPRSIGLLMIAVYLNFLGLLFIRREAPAAPVVDP